MKTSGNVSRQQKGTHIKKLSLLDPRSYKIASQADKTQIESLPFLLPCFSDDKNNSMQLAPTNTAVFFRSY
jgi:hypothetical protein